MYADKPSGRFEAIRWFCRRYIAYRQQKKTQLLYATFILQPQDRLRAWLDSSTSQRVQTCNSFSIKHSHVYNSPTKHNGTCAACTCVDQWQDASFCA